MILQTRVFLILLLFSIIVSSGALILFEYTTTLKLEHPAYAYIFIGSFLVLVSLGIAFILSKILLLFTKDLQSINQLLDSKVLDKSQQLQDSLDIINKYVIRSTTDTRGIITDASEAFCRISGYTKEELIGKPHSIVRHPDSEKEVFKQMWETIQSGKTWSGKVKNRTKNGDFYWVEAYIEPQFDAEGHIVAYAAVRNNITDKILLEESINTTNTILKFANSGIGTMDLEGNFLTVNKVYTNIFGYTEKEMLGKNCLDMTSKKHYDEAKKALEIANKQGMVSHYEKICIDKYGNEIHIDFSLNKLPDNKSFVVVVNSLEDKKKLEKINRSLNKKVAQEVEKNIKQMELMQEEQLKSVKLSSIGALAAGITHEINTPLTYIKGNFELMQFDIEDLPSSSLKERIEDNTHKILDGLNRIANIVESMREVSQISSETKAVENIYSTLHTSLTVSYNAAKTMVKIYLNGDLFSITLDKNKYNFPCYIQKQRIEQVWIIIINNALDELVKIDDYDKRLLKIDIAELDEHIQVTFQDNAGGISSDILDKLFDPFVSTKKSGGIGVGLNIAKKIVEEQKGSIQAYNKDDGAVFEVLLPKVLDATREPS